MEAQLWFFPVVFLVERGKLIPFHGSVALPPVFYSSELMTSNSFLFSFRHTIVLSINISFTFFFLVGTFGIFSDIPRAGIWVVCSPGFSRLCMARTLSPPVFLGWAGSERMPVGENRGCTDWVWGRQWVPSFMSGFLLQAAFCICTYFYIFFKAFFQVITVINFFAAKWSKRDLLQLVRNESLCSDLFGGVVKKEQLNSRGFM